jgi:serine/threonine protein phosphatase 1
MNTFVIGDIHGAYKALKQCLETSAFDYKKDTLIQLGDIVDGRRQVFECVEELLKIENLIAIKGNHDDWFNDFIQTGFHPDQWEQGGAATAASYLERIGKEHLIIPSGNGYKTALNPADIPPSHQKLFQKQHLYYIDEFNNCFVHAGFDRALPFKGQQPQTYFWDRQLWHSALSYEAGGQNNVKGIFKMVTPFQSIFIGHTSTMNWETDQPMHAANIWNLDTGAGDTGRLTIMNVATLEFWQSDPVTSLYKSE